MKLLTRRQTSILSNKVQREVEQQKLLIFGCGLGSQVAMLAARSGFSKFILIDGDEVERSNLNRQSFTTKDLGVNKAKALAHHLIAINPSSSVSVYPQKMTRIETVEPLVKACTHVINMSDPDPIMYGLNDIAMHYNKPVFFPLNVFWISYLLVFNSTTPSLEQVVGGKKIFGNSFYVELLKRTLRPVPNYLKLFIMEHKKLLDAHSFVPQLGTTAAITGAIVVNAILSQLLGLRIKLAPLPVVNDIRKILQSR